MVAASQPVYAEYPAHNFVSASGVAIFHIKSGRVVLCYHTRDKYWFLPKGRRDAGESSTRAAEREGFEEVRHITKSARHDIDSNVSVWLS
jgi:8-oxo-dGTP pyrophosphatase MutT (NUDIX family)